jgi:hypothetical protein
MDWQGNGVYRFGLIDRCRIPVDEDDCSNLEDAYCVLKSLEVIFYLFFFSTVIYNNLWIKCIE